MRKYILILLTGILTILGVCNFLKAAVLIEYTVANIPLSGINMARGTDMLILYTESMPTNSYGYEIKVDQDGYVIEASTNLVFEDGTYILSGHGSSSTLLKQAEIGDIVKIDQDLMKVQIVRNSIYSSTKKMKIQYTEFLNSYEEAKKNQVILNLEEIEKELASATTLMNDIENKSKEYSSSSTDAEAVNIRGFIQVRANILANSLLKLSSMVRDTTYVETRAIWHRPGATNFDETTLKGVQDFLDKIKDAGINEIYVETLWDGGASYRSEYLPTVSRLKNGSYGDEYGNDYFKCLIKEAHLRGIQIHAWCHMFNAGNANHQEWLALSYSGSLTQNDGNAYFYDPSNPEVIEFLCNILKEMATKYELDGIQYDYIRYAYNNYTTGFTSASNMIDSGYGEGPETRFKEATGVTGDVKTLVATDGTVREKWAAWKTTQITNAVASFTKAILSVDKNLTISCAIVANYQEAVGTYNQDWDMWVKNGDVDVVCPMLYTGSSSMVLSLSKEIMSRLNKKASLIVGLAPTYYGYNSMVNQEQIEATRKSGAQGFALFATQNYIVSNDSTYDETAFIRMKYGTNRTESISTNDSGRAIVWALAKGIRKELTDALKYEENPTSLVDNYDMYMDSLNDILATKCANPIEYQQMIEKLDDFKAYLALISADNKGLVSRITAQIVLVEKNLDLKITRIMIKNGYYIPTVDKKRPDVNLFSYEDYDDATYDFTCDEMPNQDKCEIDNPNNPDNPSKPSTSKSGCKSNSMNRDQQILYTVVGITMLLGSFYIISKKGK